MLRVLCLASLLFLTSQALAQQILWEKVLSKYPGEIKYITPADSNSFMFCGPSTKEIMFGPNGTGCGYVYLGKIRDNGDTVFIKNTGIVSEEAHMARSKRNTWYVMARSYFQPAPIIIKEFLSNGFELHSWTLSNLPIISYQMSVDTSDNILIAGSLPPVGGGLPQMGLVKITPQGQVTFATYYVPSTFTGNSIAFRLELMPGNKYFLSGSRGSIVSSYEIDSSGGVLRQKDWYQNKGNRYMYPAYCMQSTDTSFLAFGRFSIGSSYFSFIRRFSYSGDSLGGIDLDDYGFYNVKALSNGGFITIVNLNSTLSFRKYDTNFNLEFSVPFSGPPPNNFGKAITTFEGAENDAAILAGSYGSAQLPGNYFYLVKIANVGQPLDPLSSIPLKASAKSCPSSPWPNPTRSHFILPGMGKGTFRLSDGQGRLVRLQELEAGERVDMTNLPAGLYHYSHHTPQCRSTGKVLKE